MGKYIYRPWHGMSRFDSFVITVLFFRFGQQEALLRSQVAMSCFVPSVADADVIVAGFVRTRAQTYTVLHDTQRGTRWHLGRFYFFHTSSASHICSPMTCFLILH